MSSSFRRWFEQRRNCPLCQNVLTTYLHSDRRQSIKFEDGQVVVIYPLDNRGYGRKKGNEFRVGYSFSWTEDTFQIEFYDKNGFRLNGAVPNFLIERFKELNANLGPLKFFKECGSCHRYFFSSNSFILDLPGGSVQIDPLCEYVGFVENTTEAGEVSYRIYRLLTWINNNTSILYYGVDRDISNVRFSQSSPLLLSNYESLTLPLINFVSEKETLERLKKLIVFS